MIEVSDLTKTFGSVRVVDALSFSVERGEVLGFLGPNGAGKSTTMKMLTGFLSPTAGAVRVNGLDVAQQGLQVRKLLGYLPEGAPSYGEMKVRPFLEFIASARGLEGGLRNRAVDSVMQRIELKDVAGQVIDTLSKGFRRRVGLAQSILHDPEVLVLDEPTDGLDPNQKHQVRELIKGLAEDKIVVVSTHILEEVPAVCSRVIIINEGKLIANGTPAELIQQHGGEKQSLDEAFRSLTDGKHR
jgi:ABC-2 type transport system ATP-binding protein